MYTQAAVAARAEVGLPPDASDAELAKRKVPPPRSPISPLSPFKYLVFSNVRAAAAADAAAAGRAKFMHLAHQIMCARACPCFDSAGTGACYDGVELKGFAAPCADGSSCRDSGEEHAEKGRGKCG